MALEKSGAIAVVSERGDLVRTIDLGYGSAPYGIVFAPDRTAAYVTLSGKGRLLKLSPRGVKLGETEVGPMPRGLAVSGDSSRILITRFVSAYAESDGFGQDDAVGEVYEVDARTLTLTRTFRAAFDAGPDTEDSGRGVPNYLSQVRIAPDGGSAWIPSKKDNIARGEQRDGAALDFETQTRTILSQIDLRTNTELADRRIDFNDRDLAQSMAFTPMGDAFAVAFVGSNVVEVWDANTLKRLSEVNVGRAPVGLAFRQDGRRLYVHNFLDRSVSVLKTDGLLDGSANQPILVATVSTVGNEALAPEVLRGKRIFYNAADPRMSRDGYISCASCHLDGGSDGMVWDRTQFGEGFRNTIDLRGRRGANGGFVHWSANFDEIQDFEHDIRNAFGGTGFMSEAAFQEGQRDEPLGHPKAGASRELDALAAYLESLDETPDSPHRTGQGALTEHGLLGRQVFAELRCARCHSGSDFTDDGMHDVGTIRTTSGAQLEAVNTPTLKGLWLGAPYLHDGSAATLAEVLDNAVHMGSDLTEQQASYLATYLLQLDDKEPPPVLVPRAAPPAASIATVAGPVTEGRAAAFTVTLGEAAPQALSVAVDVTESGSMLSGTPPASVAFAAGDTSATLSVPTAADSVVEADSTVTATLRAGTGYSVGTASPATVTVEDDDTAELTVSVAPEAIAEGESATLTVAISNGVTFAEDQAIALDFAGGTAAQGTDYTVSSESLSLAAGATSVRATLTAVDDSDAEGAETVAVAARHEGAAIGSASLTIEASDAAVPEISIAAGTSPVTEGTAAAFTLTRTGATAAALTVSVSVTEGGAMLAANAPASVTFNVGESSATLTVATVDDAVVEGASAVTAAVASGEGYAAAAEAGSAQVSVEDNDAPSWTVSPDAVEIAEGATATLTVSAGAVTFAEAQHLAIRIAGTANADDYTLSPAVPQVAAGAGSVSVSVTATDDVREEDAETVRVTVLHGGTEIGTATVTIAASDAGTDDATLSGLTLSGIGIGTFDPATTAYTATVGSGVSSTTVTVTPSDPDASVTITDTDGSTAGTSRATSLSMGPNVITITVVSEDEQTTRIYTVAVTRLTADRAVALRRPELELDDLDDNVPFGLWSDGTTLWSSMWWSVGLVAFDLATHGRVSGRDLATASDNASPTGLWSDGTTLWVADYGGGVYAYRLSDGAGAPGEDLAATLEAAGNARPTGLWSDGTTLWVADHFDAHVYAYRLSDKARDEDREFALEDGTKAYGLWSDGTTVWTSDFGGGRVVAYRLSDGGRAAEKDYDTSKVGNEAPLGLWSDGTTLWVGDRFDGKLYAYALEAEEAASADATLASLTLSGVDIGAFDAGTTGYAASVGSAVSSTTVAATPTDADATVTITDRGGSTTDGPREVSLAAGANTITATVTAADGQTTATYTVTVTRATATPAFTVTAGQARIEEGGSTAVRVAIANGVTFAADQTITLSASGTAAAADYTLAPTTLTLDAGETAVSATLTAVDDDGEEQDETVTVSAAHNGSTVGTAMVTIAASDAAVPEISIAAGTSPITEGTAAAFTLTRTGATAEALTVSVSVTGSGAMLAANPPASVTFGADESSATLTAATVDDAVVEGASAVTAAIGSGAGYAAAAGAGSAQVSVEDNDAATFTVTAGADTVEEGGSTAVTVAIANGVTFAADQTVTLTASGTAAATDYTLAPATLALDAGETAVSATLTAVDDEDAEEAETVVVSATHGGSSIGTATVTIAASDAALPEISMAAGTSPVTEGTAAAFTLTRTGATTAALTIAVSVTESGAMLAANPPASVTFGVGESSTTLTVATDDDAVVEGASAVTAAVASGEGYAAAAGAGSASVSVEDNDAATFTVTAAPEAIAEGESTTLTVAIANGVTFAEDQALALHRSGTASPADYTGVPGALTLGAGDSSVTAELAAADDQEEEEPETVTVAVSHGGVAIGSATVTIRSVSHDATLRTLSLSGIDIGTFSPGTTDYAATVAPAMSSTTVTATASHEEAEVSIVPGAGVSLATGANEIAVTVTAEDGTTTNTYTVTVMRAEELPDPIPESIGKGEIVVAAVPFVRAPETADVATSGGATDAHARIQYLKPVPGRDRLAFNDIRGILYLTDAEGRTPAVYLDLREQEVGFYANRNPNESGFLGFAFHPEFSSEGKPGYGKFYTAFSANVSSGVADYLDLRRGHESVIREWTATDPTQDVFAGTSREVFRIGQFASNHNIATLAFNAAATAGSTDEGALYFGLGDGGGRNDPEEYGQDLSTPLGAILRINPLSTSAGTSYGIPSDNPFVAEADAASEIWAYGLRHPQHFSFDSSGRMFINDIGQDQIEEVNLGRAGGNYGWRLREGTFATASGLGISTSGIRSRVYALPSDDSGFEYPIAQYDHNEGFAISSGFVYEGQAIPALRGRYVFSELVLGRIFAMDATNPTPGTPARIEEVRITFDGQERDLADVAAYPNPYRPGDTRGRVDLRLGIDQDGELYLLTKGDGWIRRLTSPATVTPLLPEVSIAAVSSPVTEGTAATFTVTRTGATTAALTVSVSVTEDGAMLAANPPASVTFGADESSAVLTVATEDDAVVEGASAVTAAVAAGEGYAAAAGAGSAQVSVEDNDAVTFTVTAGADTVAEGGSTAVTVAIANGVTFAADQTITLSASGTAAVADYTLAPTTLRLDAGETAVSATLTAVDDEDAEQAETVVVSATHGGSSIGTATVTIEASDAAVPEISIAAGTSPVTEGTAAAFTVTRTGATAAVLTVSVSVTESGAMLAANAPASVTFNVGESSATLTAATVDDAVVEGASVVTAAVAAGEGYGAAAGAVSAQVSVEDNDAATFTVTAGQTAIAEGGSTAVTVAIANGVTFAVDQTITLSASGTAAAADYTLAPMSLALGAGATAVSATLTVVDDEAEEQGETVTVSATHNGSTVGTATVTIEASDAAVPEISIAAGTSPVTEGTAASFTVTRTGATAAALTVAVSVTESGAMLAANPPASVTFGVGEGSATLTVATEDDAVVEGASTVTAAVAAGDGYSVGTQNSASVTVEDNDAPSWTVSPDAVEIAEGATATLTVSAGAVTFAETQALVIRTTGTADAGDYTLTPAAPQIPAGAGSVAVSVTAVDDGAEEDAETVRLTVRHGGAEVGAATVTIAANDAGAGDATAGRATALRRSELDLDNLSGNVPFGLWSEDGTLWSAMWWSVGLVAFDLETHGRLSRAGHRDGVGQRESDGAVVGRDDAVGVGLRRRGVCVPAVGRRAGAGEGSGGDADGSGERPADGAVVGRRDAVGGGLL